MDNPSEQIPTVNKGGKPSLFTPEIALEIVQRLSEGEPLEAICRDPKMPNSRTVNSWKNEKVASVPAWVSTAIAQARELGFDAIAERTMGIARGKVEFGSTGDIQRDKLIVETDLKLLAKWHAKKYGDNKAVEHTVTVSLPDLVAESLRRAAEKRLSSPVGNIKTIDNQPVDTIKTELSTDMNQTNELIAVAAKSAATADSNDKSD